MENLSQILGLLLCIGVVIVALIIVFIIAKKARSSQAGSLPSQPVYSEQDRIFNEQGSARPQHDDREVNSGAGFGTPPPASHTTSHPQGGFGAPSASGGIGKPAGGGNARPQSGFGAPASGTGGKGASGKDAGGSRPSQGGFGAPSSSGSAGRPKNDSSQQRPVRRRDDDDDDKKVGSSGGFGD